MLFEHDRQNIPVVKKVQRRHSTRPADKDTRRPSQLTNAESLYSNTTGHSSFRLNMYAPETGGAINPLFMGGAQDRQFREDILLGQQTKIQEDLHN